MDAELAALAHTMAKQQLLDGDGGCACVQVIALGASLWARQLPAWPALIRRVCARCRLWSCTHQLPSWVRSDPAPRCAVARTRTESRLRLRHPALAPAAAARALV